MEVMSFCKILLSVEFVSLCVFIVLLKMMTSKTPTDPHRRNEGDFSDSCHTPTMGTRLFKP